jgi:ParB family chromosome partitioning protein
MDALVGPRAVLQANSIEWWTPLRYVELARRVMGEIDLDPATCAAANNTIKAKLFFDRQLDGLSQEWRGRVWLNPPYGRQAKLFVEYLLQQFAAGRVTQAIVLLNCNSIETKWFEPLRAYPLCFPRGRVHFISPGVNLTSSTHGSVFVYLGNRRMKFAREFSVIGDTFQKLESV